MTAGTQIFPNAEKETRKLRVLFIVKCVVAVIFSPLGLVLTILTIIAFVIVIILNALGIKVYLPPLPSSHRLAWQKIWEGICDGYQALILAWLIVGMILAFVFLVGGISQAIWHPFAFSAKQLFILCGTSFITAFLALLITLAIAAIEEEKSW